MSANEINEAIAELVGRGYKEPDKTMSINAFAHKVHWQASLPDYANDLNAMHEAEKLLLDISRTAYLENIMCIINSKAQGDGSIEETWDCCHATASQRAQAFLQTYGKWKD